MDGLYKGLPAGRTFHENYDEMAQAIENGPKNSKAVIVRFNGRGNFLERLTAQERAKLREFDRTLFLSLIDPLMKLYDDTAPYEADVVAKRRREEWRQEALPYCALAMSRVINPYLVETLLDPRPMAHHHDPSGVRWSSVSRLQECVTNSIRGIVDAHYTDIGQFRTQGLSADVIKLNKLRRQKTIGVQRAVLYKLNTTNWIKNDPQMDAA